MLHVLTFRTTIGGVHTFLLAFCKFGYSVPPTLPCYCSSIKNLYLNSYSDRNIAKSEESGSVHSQIKNGECMIDGNLLEQIKKHSQGIFDEIPKADV
ncbi:hypothetical protein GJ496_001762 [Pomphorhynchus laevis]|nr:hypothetical protein GJ496_001762 [Pomphorhynchus laevis]